MSLISNNEKALIADLFWTRFSQEARLYYKTKAKQYNSLKSLTGRRKMSAFWYFAYDVLEMMKQSFIEPYCIQELYDNLKPEMKNYFLEMNTLTIAHRILKFTIILQNEAAFLLC